MLIVPNGKKDAALRPSFPTPPFRSLKQRKQQLSKVIFSIHRAVFLISFIRFLSEALEIQDSSIYDSLMCVDQ